MTSPLRPCPNCGTIRTARSSRDICRACRDRRHGALLAGDVTPPPDWTGAACAGTASTIWFPKPAPKRHGGSKASDWDTPRAVCMSCPLLDACGRWALSDPDPTARSGMWGGMSPAERDEYRLIQNRAMKETA